MTDKQVSTEEMVGWRGQKMVGNSGDKIGKIAEIYLDQETDRAEWALVTTGMFGSNSTFVPLSGAQHRDGDVVVPFDKTQITDAPRMEDERELSRDEEAQLYRHYGLDYGDSGADAGAPKGQRGEHREDDAGQAGAGHDVSGPDTDDAMTRSEENLAVGTQSRETGRARLRKHIVTEQVTQTVPVSHEEVRVTREPITGDNADTANAGAELTEEDHEVTLHEEVPVVNKEVRPVERVQMDTAQRTGEQEVSEEVRKEQIDVEQQDDAEPRR